MSGTYLSLTACRPVPLMSYLKGLGAFRILNEQLDEHIRCSWQGEMLRIETAGSEGEVLRFFLRDYRPTPILAPWNGGSGFWDPTGTRAAGKALITLEISTHPRLASYRSAISAARDILARHHPDKGKATGSEKRDLLRRIRNEANEDGLMWIDALWAMGDGSSRFAPLLGTGGNDGNFDFSANFMQRVAEVLPLEASEPPPADSLPWLRHSLFEGEDPGLLKVSIGQFNPGGAGGPNAAQGFDGSSLVNPWDFILMIEGCLLFAGATSRRLGQLYRQASFPFTVDSSPAGAATLASGDRASSRGEVWMPLWNRPLSLLELQHLCAEGRAQVGRRAARDGASFSLALSSLGIDRGVHAFERFCFLQRNGRSYMASPQGRFCPRFSRHASLLNELMNRLYGVQTMVATGRAPGSLASKVRQLEGHLIAFAKAARGEEPWILQEILIAVSGIERAVYQNKELRLQLSPIQWLDERWWEAADDGSVEYALAAAVAALGGTGGDTMRESVTPVTQARRFVWAEEAPHIWIPSRPLWSNLTDVLRRRWRESNQQEEGPQRPDNGPIRVSLPIVARFLQSQCDDERVKTLIPALTFIRPSSYIPLTCRSNQRDASEITPIPLVYALSKVVLAYHHQGAPAFPAHWLTRMAAGQGNGLIAEMTRRLRFLGLGEVVGTYRDTRGLDSLCPDPDTLRRTSAALIIPVVDSTLPKTREGQIEREGTLLRMIAWQSSTKTAS